jgi:hypothetical protein
MDVGMLPVKVVVPILTLQVAVPTVADFVLIIPSAMTLKVVFAPKKSVGIVPTTSCIWLAVLFALTLPATEPNAVLIPVYAILFVF